MLVSIKCGLDLDFLLVGYLCEVSFLRIISLKGKIFIDMFCEKHEWNIGLIPEYQ